MHGGTILTILDLREEGNIDALMGMRLLLSHHPEVTFPTGSLLDMLIQLSDPLSNGRTTLTVTVVGATT